MEVHPRGIFLKSKGIHSGSWKAYVLVMLSSAAALPEIAVKPWPWKRLFVIAVAIVRYFFSSLTSTDGFSDVCINWRTKSYFT